MGKRGQKTFEEKIGVEKFKELLKRIGIEGIAILYCDHFLEDKDKKKCEACKRTIYRAKKRIEKRERKQKRYDPMENFRDIPEIQKFIAHERDKKKKKSWNSEVNQLEEMWQWIRENPELKALSRPALWDMRHIEYILKKVDEKQVAPYGPKYFLRMFFESQRNPLKDDPLIGARRSDMRSPKGPRRQETSFAPDLLPKIREPLNDEEIMTVDLALNVKSREGKKGVASLLNIQWKHIRWHDKFYGLEMVTVDVYESKTKGGTWWRHCPLDLWFADLSKRLREKWERLGKPKEGYVLDCNYQGLLDIWKKISEHVGRKLEPHDCRRSTGGWLRDLGLSDLAMGHYSKTKGEGIGYTGVGWENAEIYFQHYGRMNPKAIYNAELRLNPQIFTGLIRKILEERAKQINIMRNGSY